MFDPVPDANISTFRPLDQAYYYYYYYHDFMHLLNQAVNSNIRYNGNGYLPCNGFVPCQVFTLLVSFLILQRCQAKAQVLILCANNIP